MFGKLIGWFAPYLLPAAGAVMVFSLLFGGAQTWRLHRAQAKTLETQRMWDAERARLQAAAIVAQNEFRETERQWIEAKQEAEDVKAKERARGERIAAGLRTELAGVRVALDEFAAGSGSATEDSLAACHQRAAALGRFVADGVRVQETLADRAETAAADVRSLRAAWPR